MFLSLVLGVAAFSAYLSYHLFKWKSLTCNGKIVTPIRDVLDNPEAIQLNLHKVRTPPVSGYALKLLGHLYYTNFGKYFLSRYVIASSNLNLLADRVIPEPPTLGNIPPCPVSTKSIDNSGISKSLLMEHKRSGSGFNSISDFYIAYKSGSATPLAVAHSVISAIKDSNAGDKPLRAITSSNDKSLLSMAEASTERWQNGSPLSLLDGVPISINEFLLTDMYPCLVGVTFVPEFMKVAPQSKLVQRLIEAGAVIIGVTNMPEFGTNSIGSSENLVHKQPRNPYNVNHFPGGSSSGCAVSVACGLCPVSIGADGGGSGRVPAAVCGACTLIMTRSRFQSSGCFDSFFSFSSVTPIATSPLDVAIVVEELCRNEEGGTNGDLFPLDLKYLSSREVELSGLTVGIYWEWVEAADSSTVEVFRKAVKSLAVEGIEVRPVKIPELEEVRVAHIIHTVSELSALTSVDVDKSYSSLGPSATMVAALGHCFSALEMVNALKQKTRTMTALKAIFEEVDVIATPTVGCPIPKITSEYLSGYGKLDGEAIGSLDMFTFLACFAGIPAVTIPVGVLSEEANLPVGLQLMGPWYQDEKLLKYAHAIEKSGIFPALKPEVHYEVLTN